MKASNGTSAAPSSGAETTPTQAAGPRSASSRPRIAEPPVGGFPLVGPSDLPDPAHYAYRKDLADVALAGRVIASHYAEPLERRLLCGATLLQSAEEGAPVLAQLPAGETLRMLDNSRGWAWGYAGDEGLVGYVRSEAI